MVRPFLPHTITTDSAIGGSKIERSLRFRHGGNWAMTRTSENASSTFTFSCWIKHTKLDDYKYIFSSGGAGIAFNGTTSGNSNQLYVWDGNTLTTSGAFLRDTNSWYHIVVKMNSGTVYTYINGSVCHNGIGGFSLSTSGDSTRIGRYPGDHELEGYLADVHLVDGQALDPTSFAYTESQTGLWKPKKYTGTYGTSGFHLEFKDTSSVAAFGKDTSGNGNDFTSTNFLISDNVPDSPTNNFALMSRSNGMTGIREAGLKFQVFNDSGGAQVACQSDMLIPKTGTWYWEVRWLGNSFTRYWGITRRLNNYTGVYYHNTGGIYYEMFNGKAFRLTGGNSTEVFSGGFTGYNDGVVRILGMTVNMDQMIAKYYMNNSFVCSVSIPELPNDGLSDQYAFSWVNTNGGSSSSINDRFNFGQDSSFIGAVTNQYKTDANGIGDFYYTPPDNALALCSQNTPPNLTSTKSIINPEKHFGTLVYVGNGATANHHINGLQFKPDFVWLKNRSLAYDFHLYDSVRGSGKWLESNTTDSEARGPHMDGFLPNGFSVGNGVNSNRTNYSGNDYVAWCWKAGSPKTPTSGSVDFDGSGDYMSVASSGGSSDLGMGTGDFTVECWVKKDIQEHRGIWQISGTVGGLQSTSYGQTLALGYQAGVWQTYGGTATTDNESASYPIVPDKWYHTAVCRSSGTTKLFIDGQQVLSYADAHDYGDTRYMVIGGYYNTSYLHRGGISNLNVVKGTALYTSNFTPPTEPLTAHANTKFLLCQSNKEAGNATVYNNSGVNDGTQWSHYLTGGGGFQGSYPAKNAFNGTISGANTSRSTDSQTTQTFAPPSGIPYSSSVEVWTWMNGTVSLNGGSNITVSNDQSFRQIATGSGTLNDIRFNSASGNSVYIAGIRVDGTILVEPDITLNGNVHADSTNPFDAFTVDGVSYQSASAAGLSAGSGTITAASVNKEAGFSIISYMGNATANQAQTIAHGLDKAPEVIWYKIRSDGGQGHFGWAVYHVSMPDASTDYVKLNTNEARIQTDTDYMNGTLPTSSVFSMGYNFTTNKQNQSYIAYCWHSVPGYSKMGVYQGNGQHHNNAFVDCGFRPACVIFKAHTRTDDWGIFDNKRVDTDPPNPLRRFLYPNDTYAEWTGGTNDHCDFYSNGFKMQNLGSMIGGSNEQYIYMAFASHPGDDVFDLLSEAN